jgi:uncharacterized membrane protein
MFGEEYGWVPLDGLTILVLLIQMIIVIMIPGFLLSLGVFPKRKAMSMGERLALSFGLGLAAPFLLTMLNISVGMHVNYVTSIMVFLALSAIGILAFIYRGGDINLLKWYTATKA